MYTIFKEEDIVKMYHEGVRWSVEDLTERERDELEYLKLDYRNMSTFAQSFQVLEYVKKSVCEYYLDKFAPLFLSYKKNNTNFEWSDITKKAYEFINGNYEFMNGTIPIGSDPVFFVYFQNFQKIKMDTYNPYSNDSRWHLYGYDLDDIYFIGENLPVYKYTPVNPFRAPCDDIDNISPVGWGEYSYWQTILSVMALEGDMSFCSHKWSIKSINDAIRIVEIEIRVIIEDQKFYQKFYNGDYDDKHDRDVILKKSLRALNDLKKNTTAIKIQRIVRMYQARKIT